MRIKIAMRIAARASRREGTITKEQYHQIIQAIRHPEQKQADGTVINLLEKIEAHVTEQIGKQGIRTTLDNIIQWFKDHWLQILQVILAFAPIFLAKPETNNET